MTIQFEKKAIVTAATFFFVAATVQSAFAHTRLTIPNVKESSAAHGTTTKLGIWWRH